MWFIRRQSPLSLLFLAGCILILPSFSACAGGGGAGQPIQHREITGTYPGSDYFLELVSPQARSVIQVEVEELHWGLCRATVDGNYSRDANCSYEQLLQAFGLKKTGPLARVEENSATSVYQHRVTIIDEPDELLFLSVDRPDRGPWEDVLEEEGYRRSEVRDVVLWVGPPPWEAFAFIGHGLIVSDTETRMTELLERRDSRGPSFYDAAGDFSEFLHGGAGPFPVWSVERTLEGVMREFYWGPHHQGDEVVVHMSAYYMNPQQAEIDSQEWLSEWRSTLPQGCRELVANLEGLLYEFQAECQKDVVLNEFLDR